MITYVVCFITCYKPILIYWRLIMKKFLIGAAIGGAVALWGHKLSMKGISRIAKANQALFGVDEPTARRNKMHIVK